MHMFMSYSWTTIQIVKLNTFFFPLNLHLCFTVCFLTSLGMITSLPLIQNMSIKTERGLLFSRFVKLYTHTHTHTHTRIYIHNSLQVNSYVISGIIENRLQQNRYLHEQD